MSNYSELNLLNPSAKFSNLSFRQCKIIWKDRIRSLLRQPSWNGLLCHQFGLKRSGGRRLCYSDCKCYRLRRLRSHLSPHINNFIYLFQLFVNKKNWNLINKLFAFKKPIQWMDYRNEARSFHLERRGNLPV